MAIGERLKFRQSLQRSAKAWLMVLEQELNKERPHGLSIDGRPKSRFSPVSSNSIGRKKGSGGILDTGYEIVSNEENGQYEIIFGLPGYVIALDQGVRVKRGVKSGGGGTSPFISSLLNWIQTKNIRLEPGMTKLGLAIAIRANIFKKGIKGTDILTKVNERFVEEFSEELADGYMMSMEDYVIDNIKRIEENFRK